MTPNKPNAINQPNHAGSAKNTLARKTPTLKTTHCKPRKYQAKTCNIKITACIRKTISKEFPK